jgi:putative NIF3 family GTP cyclohydrolase 1 type 2
MEALNAIAAALDDFFDIAASGADPAFSRFLPAAYDQERRPWRSWMEAGFATRFNGLMIRGGESVAQVFLAAFPSEVVLQQFLRRSSPGDLLFVHHPLDLESGDPRGSWGRFFRPMSADVLRQLQERGLSVYSCHAPLDYNERISTARSIAAALNGTVAGHFFPYGPGHAGVIATLAPIACAELEASLLRTFELPYLDTAGGRPAHIETIAIVAGAGDRVEQMAIAEAAGAQAYITGEIHSRIDTEYGHTKFAEVERFAAASAMALLGVSHAASEFLVMRNEMRAWFSERFAVQAIPLAEEHWWR